MDKELKDVLIKRAKGFYYNEQTAEYEVVGGEKFFLCKKFSRLYFGDGYLKVKIIKIYVGNKIVRLNDIFAKRIQMSAKSIKKLRIYKKKAKFIFKYKNN